MGSIGDAFPYAVPTVGSSNYGTGLVNVLDELVTRVSSPVPLSVLSGNDLDMGNQSVVNVKTVQFEEQGSAPATSPAGVIEYYDSNFWFVTADGAIQITDGDSLNIVSN